MNEITLQPSRLPIAPAIAREYELSPASWRVLVETVFPAAKSIEAVLTALAYCKARNLDIFKRPVHIVPMWNTQKRGYVETVWEGIASVRTTASRTGAYAGIDAVEYGGTIRRVFKGTKDTYERGQKTGTEVFEKTVDFPEWASVVVYRMVGNRRCAYHAKVYWEETYGTMGKTDVPNDMWGRRPFGQIDKCVEAAALRKAFPEELGSTYTADEMEGHTIEGSIDVPEIAAPTPPKPPERRLGGEKPVSSTTKMEPLKPPKPAPGEARTDQQQNKIDKAISNIGTEFEREVNEEADRLEKEHGEESFDEDEATQPAPGDLLSELDEALGTAKTADEIETIYDDFDLEARLEQLPKGEEFVGTAISIKRRHLKRVTNG